MRQMSMMTERFRDAVARSRAIPAAGKGAAGAALVSIALLAGCGTEHAGSAAGTGTPRPSAPAQAGGPTGSLIIQFAPGAGSPSRKWTLQCGPSGGSLPGAASACAAVARSNNPFGPVPRGKMCSMIYGGPQTATVVGTWEGKAVNASYSRTNSCQTARWNMLASMFPAAVTPGPTAPGGGQVNPGGPMLPGPSQPGSSPATQGGATPGGMNPGGRMSPGPGGGSAGGKSG